jgi:hypothetical protein
MRGNHYLAGLKPARTIGAAGLTAGVMLAGGISGAPGAVSAKLTSAEVPSPQPPTPGPLVIGPKAIIIGDPGGDGPGPKAVIITGNDPGPGQGPKIVVIGAPDPL